MPLKDFSVPGSLVLPTGKVAGKVVLALALVTTDVALERVLVAMATHVDGVQDVVWEINVTVLAVVQDMGVLEGCRQAVGGCAGLAVGDTGCICASAVITAGSSSRTATAMWGRTRFWSNWGGGGGVSHADCHGNRCCGWVGLLNEEGFLINNRLFSWRHWRLGLGLGVRG